MSLCRLGLVCPFAIAVFVSGDDTSKASTVTYDLTVIANIGMSGTGVLSVNGPLGPRPMTFVAQDPNVLTLTFTFGSFNFDFKNDPGATYGPIEFFNGNLTDLKAHDFVMTPASEFVIDSLGQLTFQGNVEGAFASGLILSQLRETPLPATLPLFASGGALLGSLGWRRKRKAQTAA